MITVKDKNQDRLVRHARVRKTIVGTTERPRLNVYRSLNNIYAQIIDDSKGVTIASASTLDKEVAELIKDKTKTEAARIVGEVVAKRAQAKKIEEVVFDRGGYLYTGRVQAVADGARAAGLKF
ncbi:MAG: 50S ribosomal protein L18 [Clostridia bacterium]|jgi:large subunit ribosomal protein L18|nr:50S ribosomal protein L18 [Clostridia bacterium]